MSAQGAGCTLRVADKAKAGFTNDSYVGCCAHYTTVGVVEGDER